MKKPSSLDRRTVVADILAPRGDALVITGLGSPTYDVAAAGDHPLNFYLWGAMGGAAVMGLGLAYAQPRRRVLVITGDGEMLMGLGSLVTIGCERPKNLAIVVLDNGHYGETGMQRAHTGRGLDLAAVARSTLFRHAATVTTAAALGRWIPRLYRDDGPLLLNVKVGTAPVPAALPVRDGPQIRTRFRAALLGPRAAE